jgi:methyl-accepting chemotaxis protein
MLDNVKISVKLIGGFLAVCGIAAVIGVLGITSAAKLNGAADRLYNYGMKATGEADDIKNDLLYMERAYRNMAIFNDKASLAASYDVIEKNTAEIPRLLDSLSLLSTRAETQALIREARDKFRNYLRDGTVFYEFAIEARSEMPDNLSAALRQLRVSGNEFEDVVDKIGEAFNSAAASISDDAAKTYVSVRNMLLTFLIAGILIGVAFGYYLSGSISKPLSRAVNMMGEMSHGSLGMRLNMNRKDEIGTMANSMDKFADSLQNEVVKVMQMISEGDLSMDVPISGAKDEVGPALKQTVEALRGLIIEDGGKVLNAAANKDLSQRLVRDYKGEFAKMKSNINEVVRNLDEAMSQVAEAASQVSSASSEISSGSQNLAEGSNEQASSLEEVSSSLEEMSSMTKQNADNSNQAKILASEARGAADEGDAAMKNMSVAINEIKQSSDKTAKIVKTIDEIAFQTNLLALNAAVEAARAGEAGKGFAVVAEEVRNLAMRSAEAAKNTTEMIEESVKNADSGVKITEEVAKSLNQIVDRVGKVGDLIAEIAAASNEQALGIEQVNTAVASMNQVTQQNAANSEESASAAEELSSQAAELQNMVAAFTLTSGGSGSRGAQQYNRRGLPPPQKRQAALPAPKAAGAKSAKAVKPDQLIPLDDEDFGDF